MSLLYALKCMSIVYTSFPALNEFGVIVDTYRLLFLVVTDQFSWFCGILNRASILPLISIVFVLVPSVAVISADSPDGKPDIRNISSSVGTAFLSYCKLTWLIVLFYTMMFLEVPDCS